jgi:glutaredoxin
METMQKSQTVSTKDLVLYYYEECYYCQKVLRKLKEYNLDIQLKNTRENQENYLELRKINHGITQVPCLVIKGEPMLESEDIIHYLIETFVKD